MTGKQFVISNVGTTKYHPLPLGMDLGVIQTRDKPEEPSFHTITRIKPHSLFAWHSSHFADKAPDRVGAGQLHKVLQEFFIAYSGFFGPYLLHSPLTSLQPQLSWNKCSQTLQ